MGMTAFLPGLILALAVWIIPPFFRILPARWIAPIAERFPRFSVWAPWIHSLGLPYAGLVVGWIAARDYGLAGQTLAQWGIGSAAAVLFGLLLGRVSVRFASAREWGDVRDEARWTLYRAAAWPWLKYLSAAVGVGFLLSLGEFAFQRRKGDEGYSLAATIPFLIRSAGSSALFLLAHNFLLAMLYYLTAYIASKPEFSHWIGNTRARIAKKTLRNR
jgi:hypothetical protein